MTVLAVDIGGTFTDLMAYDPGDNRIVQAKSLTTPDDLVRGVLDCVDKSGIPAARVASLIHGSTIAINTLIERKGAKAALVVTEGTRDVYAIGRGNRPEAYNLLFRRARPLVARRDTFEAHERMMAGGEVRTPLDDAEIARLTEALTRGGFESVAVCFLHAYANPEHEQKLGAALNQALPGCYVSLSHEIMREYREYERTSTTAVNAYIGPRVGGYVRNLETGLAGVGFAGELSIMQSNGGVMAPSVAVRRPVTMMESGPVGGIIAAAEVGRRLGHPNAISFDMGGTTAKASLIGDGQVTMAEGYYVGGYASGDPVMAPVADIVEVGAGGGSIAWLDEVGALKVGPHSAGADPGPIAYRLGGAEPTITDANVVLGRIGADDFLGGEMKLDAESARAGIARLGDKLHMSAEETARAIVSIAIAKMSLAVRQVSVERGFDPREFALVASGGAGPLHASAIARELHVPTVIIPCFPAHFSALGMLIAEERHDFVRTYLARLGEVDFATIGMICEEMIAEAGLVVRKEAAAVPQLSFDLRYVGQEFSLPVPVSQEQIAAADRGAIRAEFDRLHEQRYAHRADDEEVEIINIRLSMLGSRALPSLPKPEADQGAHHYSARPVLFDGEAPVANCPVYRRDALTPGADIAGPALIQEYASTAVLFPGDRCRLGDGGELVITVGATR